MAFDIYGVPPHTSLIETTDKSLLSVGGWKADAISDVCITPSEVYQTISHTAERAVNKIFQEEK